MPSGRHRHERHVHWRPRFGIPTNDIVLFVRFTYRTLRHRRRRLSRHQLCRISSTSRAATGDDYLESSVGRRASRPASSTAAAATTGSQGRRRPKRRRRYSMAAPAMISSSRTPSGQRRPDYIEGGRGRDALRWRRRQRHDLRRRRRRFRRRLSPPAPSSGQSALPASSAATATTTSTAAAATTCSVGGLGFDTHVGGPGNDIFEFNSTAESPKGSLRDLILDFKKGDRIDVSGIDAKDGGGDDRSTSSARSSTTRPASCASRGRSCRATPTATARPTSRSSSTTCPSSRTATSSSDRRAGGTYAAARSSRRRRLSPALAPVGRIGDGSIRQNRTTSTVVPPPIG